MRQNPEAQLARQIVSFLELDGWRAVKMEPLARRDWGKGSGELGMPDYQFVRYMMEPNSKCTYHDDRCRAYTETLWIEFKAPRGRISEKQKQWHAAERARGALVLVAKEDFEPTLEGFASWYKASGLQRRTLRVGAA